MTAQGTDSSSSRSSFFAFDVQESKWTLAVVLSSATYLFFNLFGSLRVPYLLSGDQVYFWTYAQRMLLGEHVYRDFFQFTPPGTDLVYLLVFRIFGPRLWVTNAIVLLLGVFLCWMCYSLGRSIMSRRYALLGSAFFLVLIYGRLLNATHHWFSLAAVLGAIMILRSHTTSLNAFGAGALLGFGSFFTQSRGLVVLLAFVMFFAWERSRSGDSTAIFVKRLLLLFGGFFLTWLALSAYFIVSVGFKQLWYYQVIYAGRYMATAHSLGLPQPISLRTLPSLTPYLLIYFMVPVSAALALWKTIPRKERPDREARIAALLALAGLALAFEVTPSPNWLRIFCVAMPAVILSFWLIYQNARTRGVASCLAIAILVFALFQSYARRSHQTSVVSVPAGITKTTRDSAEKLNWLAQHTVPGEAVFQAAWPGIYLPLRLHNPLYIDVLESRNLTRPEFVESAVSQLETKPVRYILWTPRLNAPDPAEGETAYHLAPFREFLFDRYRRIHTFADGDELWEPK